MTLIPECIHALARATAIAAAALGGGVAICALLRGLDARLRSAAWIVLFVPFLTPAPLVGYAWGHFALSLVRHPFMGEMFYALILVLRLAPVAALVLRVTPATTTREAVHCHRLGVSWSPPPTDTREEAEHCRLGGGGRGSASSRAAFAFHLWGRPAGIALALTFLMAFGDFELAALLGVRSWTVTLFDAHAGGLALSPALGMVLPPTLIEAAALFAVMAVAFGGRRLPAASSGAVRRRGRVILVMVSACVALALLLTTVVPLAIITRSMLPGLRAFAEAVRLMPEILAALLFAASSAGLAWLGAGWIVNGSGLRRPGKRRLLSAFALSVPGLLGALVLSLLVLSLFQIPGLRAAYDTPAPLLLAYVLLLLPPAMLLRLLLRRVRPDESLHAALLLRRSDHVAQRRAGRAIVRQLRGNGPFWALFLLFCWAYFDMTAASILAPLRMTPVFVRLYNLMHYGRTNVLSIMVCLALAAPLAALALAAAGMKLAAAVSESIGARRGRVCGAPTTPVASS